MWLSEQTARKSENQNATVGSVTIGGAEIGVYSDAEMRGVKIYAPHGYMWRPKVGDEVLVIKCAGGEKIAVGVKAKENISAISDGEICIKTDSASVIIKNTGELMINGNVSIVGSLKVNGNKIG